jgi:hypothetical protein
MNFVLDFVSWSVVFLGVTLLAALIPFANRVRKEGAALTWRKVGGPTLVFGVLATSATIGLILAAIEGVFGGVPSFVTGIVAILNGMVFWQWAKSENRAR